MTILKHLDKRAMRQYHNELLKKSFRRTAKVQCSQIHKDLNMDLAVDILADFRLAYIAKLYPCEYKLGRRGRRKFPVWSAAFVADESRSDD